VVTGYFRYRGFPCSGGNIECKKILRELQKNCRISAADLAEKLGMSTTPCRRRQKELEEKGYIKRYAAIVDRRKVGLTVCCYANISLNRHSEGVVEKFESEMRMRPAAA